MTEPFVDSNIIIRAFTENENKDKCRNILADGFVTNTLCLIEAQAVIATIKKDKLEAAHFIKSLFKSNGFIVDVDKNLLFESFRRINMYNLNFFDLINYTTALINNCTEVVSYDRDFDGLEIKRVEP